LLRCTSQCRRILLVALLKKTAVLGSQCTMLFHRKYHLHPSAVPVILLENAVAFQCGL
jgi:hypothetical protein